MSEALLPRHTGAIPATSDVCVVGGGPAGLSSAIALAQKGLSVTLVDCATPPIDKACGEGLMPDSLAVLQRLGVAIPFEAGFRFRGIRFCNRTSSVAADFPNGSGLGLRRAVLHQLLAQRAQELKVALCWGVKNVQLANRGISVNGQSLSCRFVVGADGQNSRIRRDAGLNRMRKERRRYGFRMHYRVPPWSDQMELHWGSKSQLYITPVSQDEICVALISRDPALRLQRALSDFPEVHARLQNAAALSDERGALTVSRVLKSVSRVNVALAGDASGSVDAVTGEGMCLSFKQSLALADAIEVGKLPGYESAHRSLSRLPRVMASLMLTLDKYDGFQRRGLASLERHPDFFAALLAIHVGELRFRDLCSWQLVDLCRSFLAA